MYITLEADYAVRIVHCLAEAKKRVDAKTIADCTGVTLRFSLKILRKLVAAGIIKSYKGAQGGYQIAKPLNEITLYDPISAIEGHVCMSRCVKDDFVCSMQPGLGCPIREVFLSVSNDIIKKLQSYTFDRFVD